MSCLAGISGSKMHPSALLLCVEIGIRPSAADPDSLCRVSRRQCSCIVSSGLPGSRLRARQRYVSEVVPFAPEATPAHPTRQVHPPQAEVCCVLLNSVCAQLRLPVGPCSTLGPICTFFGTRKYCKHMAGVEAADRENHEMCYRSSGNPPLRSSSIDGDSHSFRINQRAYS